jgi:hypothetical protein
MNLEFSRVESRDEDDLRKKVGKPGSKKKKKLNLLMKVSGADRLNVDGYRVPGRGAT